MVGSNWTDIIKCGESLLFLHAANPLSSWLRYYVQIYTFEFIYILFENLNGNFNSRGGNDGTTTSCNGKNLAII